jgi:hypothetical protein
MGFRPAPLVSILLLLACLALPNLGPAAAADRDGSPAGVATRYVDTESIGGRCSDARDSDQAKSATTPWCSLARAAASAPAGSLVLVRTGDYGRFALTSPRDGDVTFRPYPGEQPTLRGGVLRSSGIRLEGFRITGTVILEAPASRVAFVSNDWITNGRDGGTNLSLRAGVRDVLVEGNRLGHEAGIRGNGINFSSTNTRAAIEDVTIRGNAIGPIRDGGDGIQAKNTQRLVIEANEIFGVSRPDGSRAHPDAIQSIYGAVDLVIRDNFIHDIGAQGVFIESYRGENRNFRAEGNVITRVAYPWTEFAARANGGYVGHNTIDGLMLVGGSFVDALGNIATTGLAVGKNSWFVREDYNLSRRFTRSRGPHSLQGSPAFAAPDDFTLLPGSPGKGAAPDGSDIGSGGRRWRNG